MAAPAQTQGGFTFSLFGIPVTIRAAFLIIPAFGALQESDAARGAAWIGLVFISVLVHELGHALSMRAFGYQPTIELIAFGGLTHWPPGARPPAGRRFVVTFAGPLAGLVLGGAFAIGAALGDHLDPLIKYFVTTGAFVNIFWSVINLAPVLPWDGGSIVDSGLELLTGRPQPRVVGVLSIVVAVAVMVFAVYSRVLMLGYFALMGMMAGWRRIQSGAQTDAAEKAWQLVMSGDPVGGEQVALERLRVAGDASERARLIEIVAWARLHRGEVRGAKEAIAAMQDFTPSVELSARLAAAENDAARVVELLEPLVPAGQLPGHVAGLLVSALVALEQPARVVQLCRQLSEAGQATPAPLQTALHDASAKLFGSREYQASYEVCVLGFERFGTAVFGFNAACCLAKLGRLDDGLAWVGRAVDGGYAELDVLEKDEDIAPVRALPGYAALVEKARARSMAVPSPKADAAAS